MEDIPFVVGRARRESLREINNSVSIIPLHILLLFRPNPQNYLDKTAILLNLREIRRVANLCGILLKMKIHSFTVTFQSFCVLFLISGCETVTPTPSSSENRRPAVQSEFVKNYLALEKGMTSEQIIQRFGEPDKIEPKEAGGVKTELWRYTHVLESQVESNTQGTIEEPYWDIFENKMKTREVAIEGTERREVIARLELLFFEAQLLSWKDEIDRRRTDY